MRKLVVADVGLREEEDGTAQPLMRGARRVALVLIGAAAGFLIVPPLWISIQDSFHVAVDPIFGGIFPAIVGAILGGTAAHFMARRLREKAGPGDKPDES